MSYENSCPPFKLGRSVGLGSSTRDRTMRFLALKPPVCRFYVREGTANVTLGKIFFHVAALCNNLVLWYIITEVNLLLCMVTPALHCFEKVLQGLHIYNFASLEEDASNANPVGHTRNSIDSGTWTQAVWHWYLVRFHCIYPLFTFRVLFGSSSVSALCSLSGC